MRLNADKLRVLIGHNYYQQPGGEDGFFRSEVSLLQSHGHELCVYERHNDDIKTGILSKTSHALSLRFSKASYEQTRALIREFKPDVAHFHNTFFVMTPSVLYACRDEGVPVVLSLHNFRLMCINGLFLRDGKPCEECLNGARVSGIIHRCYRDSLASSILAADMINAQWRRKTWVNVVDRFLVATEFTMDKYTQAGIPASKFTVLPPYIYDMDQSASGTGGFALYCGRLSGEKGIDVLLNAWRTIKDFPLYIVGQGPLQKQLEDTIRENGMENVRMLGFLENSEYLKLLAKARFLVVPSVCYENFPRVVVEAYACGVPVVANALGTMQEVVEHGCMGSLYAANDPADLAIKAVELIRDDELYRRLSGNARQAYESRYTPQRHYEGLLAVYQGMVAHAKSI